MEDKGLKTHIIYNKKDGWELARLIYESLQKNGFTATIEIKDDVESKNLTLNPTSKVLIEDANIIIVLLSRKCLNSYKKNKNSSFIKELEYTLKLAQTSKKFIIPVIDDLTFKFNDDLLEQLPDNYSLLNRFQTIFVNEKFFVNSVQNLFNTIVDQEFKQLIKVDRNVENPREDNPKYSPDNIKKIKKLSDKEIEQEVNKLIESEDSKKIEYLDDLNIYKELILRYGNTPINVLDLGCGDGQFAKLLFEDISINLNTYIGLDIQPNKIVIAKQYIKKSFTNVDRMSSDKADFASRFNFDTFNINDPNSHEILMDKLYKLSPKKGEVIHFNIIILRNVLQDIKHIKPIIELCNDFLIVYDKKEIKTSNYEQYKEDMDQYLEDRLKQAEEISSKNPEVVKEFLLDFVHQTEKKTNKFLSKYDDSYATKQPGILIITESDDGFDLCYPDNNFLFRQFYRLLNDCPNAGNRFTGREIYTHLIESGFRDIKLKSLTDSSFNENVKATNTLSFKQTYLELIKNYEFLVKDYPNNKDYNIALNWLKENKNEIFKQADSKEFFILKSHLIWVGKK